jgi:hypothetical protein
MMGKTDGGGRTGEGRRSIAWTMTKRVEDTEATQFKWSCKIEGEYQTNTNVWNCEMEGEEIFLLVELHPCYTKNSYHSPLTIW